MRWRRAKYGELSDTVRRELQEQAQQRVAEQGAKGWAERQTWEQIVEELSPELGPVPHPSSPIVSQLIRGVERLGTDFNGNPMFSEMRQYVDEYFPDADRQRRHKLIDLMTAAADERSQVAEQIRKAKS